MRRLKIFVSAGEASGDLHGSRLVAEILKRNPTARVDAMGGARLRSAGADILVDYRDLALIGVVQVLPKARSIYRAWKRIRRHLQAHRPDLVILIDFPDFNFLVGRAARALGLKVFYYISPQVWAWRSGRVRSLKRFVDAMAVILPFEEAFYRKRGMTVHFVGHPLVDEVRSVEDQATCRRRLGLVGSEPRGLSASRKPHGGSPYLPPAPCGCGPPVAHALSVGANARSGLPRAGSFLDRR